MRPESRSSLTIFCVVSIFIHLIGLAVWRTNHLSNPGLGSTPPPEIEVTLEPSKNTPTDKPVVKKPEPEKSLKVEQIAKETSVVKPPKPELPKPKPVEKPVPKPDPVVRNNDAKPQPEKKPDAPVKVAKADTPKPQPPVPDTPQPAPKEDTATPSLPDIAKSNDAAPRLDTVGRNNDKPVAKESIAPLAPRTGSTTPDEQPDNTAPAAGLASGKAGVVGIAAPSGAATGGNVNALAEPVDASTVSPNAFIGGGSQPRLNTAREIPTTAPVAANRPAPRTRETSDDQPDNTVAASIAPAKVAPRTPSVRTTASAAPSLNTLDAPDAPVGLARTSASPAPRIALNTLRAPAAPSIAIPRRLTSPRPDEATSDQPNSSGVRLIASAQPISGAPRVRGGVTRSKPDSLADTIPDVQPIAGARGGTGGVANMKTLRSDTLASNGSIPQRAPSFHARTGGGTAADEPGFGGSGKATPVATVNARTGGGKATIGSSPLDNYAAIEKPEPGVQRGSSTQVALSTLRYEPGRVVQSGTRQRANARPRGGGQSAAEEPSRVDAGPIDTVGKVAELPRVGNKTGNGVSALASPGDPEELPSVGAGGTRSVGDLAPLQNGVSGRTAVAGRIKKGNRPTGTANELPEANIAGESGETKVALIPRKGGRAAHIDNNLADTAPDEKPIPTSDDAVAAADLSTLRKGAVRVASNSPRRPTVRSSDSPDLPTSAESMATPIAPIPLRNGAKTARVNSLDATPDATITPTSDATVASADLSTLRQKPTQVASNTPRKTTARSSDPADLPTAEANVPTSTATVTPRRGSSKLNTPNLGGDALPDQRPNLGPDASGDPSAPNIVRETGRGIAVGSGQKKPTRLRAGDPDTANDQPIADVNAPIQIVSGARVGGSKVKSGKINLDTDNPTPDAQPNNPTAAPTDSGSLGNLRRDTKTVASKSGKAATKRIAANDQPDAPSVDDATVVNSSSAGTPKMRNVALATGLSSSFFGIVIPKADPDAPINDVYLIDVSKSMGDGGKIGKAKQTLKDQLARLKTKDHFNIICFAGTTRKWRLAMQSATTENVDSAIDFLDKAQLSSNTDISDAIQTALSQKSVSRVFLLSDGDPNGGIEDFAKLRAKAKEWNTNNAKMYAFALIIPGDDSGTSLLKGLADDSEGKFFPVHL